MAGTDRFFDRIAPGLLIALLLAGSYYDRPPLAALSLTMLLTLWLTRHWSGQSLRRLHFDRETNDERAFPGDELLLTLRIENDKLLPLPWVEVDERLPRQLSLVSGDSDKPRVEQGSLKLACSLGWKERVTWRYRLLCRQRGIFRLGPAIITSGDPFGFFPRSAARGETRRVVVYPRLIPVEQLSLPAGFPLGDARPQLWIFEDPSRNVGVREYHREDSFRRIHWKASARRQELQVKVHEPTTTLEVALFLALDTFGAGWGDGETGGRGDGETRGWGETETRGRGDAETRRGDELSVRRAGACPPPPGSREGERDAAAVHPDYPRQSAIRHSILLEKARETGGGDAAGGDHAPGAGSIPGRGHDSELFEHAVSVIASVAQLLLAGRHPVGLYVNGGSSDTEASMLIPPAGTQEQLLTILEALAGVEERPCVPIATLLAEVGTRLPWGSSVIVVTGSLPESLLSSLRALERSGKKPLVLLAGPAALPDGSDAMSIHRV